MKNKTIIFIIIGAIIMQTACIGSFSSKVNEYGILGEFGELLKEYYEKVLNYKNNVSSAKSQEEKIQMEKIVEEAYIKLEESGNKLIGHTISTEIETGVPLKLISPFVVDRYEFRNGIFLDAMTGIVPRITIKAEVELTANIKAHQKTWNSSVEEDERIKLYLIGNDNHLIGRFELQSLKQDYYYYYNNLSIGTRMKLIADIYDRGDRIYEREEGFASFLIDPQKIVIHWDNPNY